MVELLRGAMQDAFQSSLDNGAGSQDPLTQLHQSISDLKAPQQTHYLASIKHPALGTVVLTILSISF